MSVYFKTKKCQFHCLLDYMSIKFCLSGLINPILHFQIIKIILINNENSQSINR